MRRGDLILTFVNGFETIEIQRLKALCYLAEKEIEIEIDRRPNLPEPIIPKERDGE